MVDRVWGLPVRWAGAGLALAAIGLSGCWRSHAPEVESPSWDTTLIAAGKTLTDQAVLDRAFVLPGSEGYLQDFLSKCRKGGDVRIGFIGGSITAGAGASDSSRRYSTSLCRYLGKLFPHTRFLEINAGIGSTGSRFAGSRARYDLYPGLPDLIVVEFAVNDDLGDTATSASTFEGLVRQCRAKAPVVVFQTVNPFGHDINQRIQAAVSERYGLPVVSYREAFWPYIKEGSLPWSSLTADDIHPNDTGHAAGAYLLFAFLKRAAASGDTDAFPAQPLPAAAPFYANADLMHVGDTTLKVAMTGGWDDSADAEGRIRMVSSNAGEILVLETRARELTLCWRSARDGAGRVAVRVEGGRQDTLKARQGEGVPDGSLVFKTLGGLDGTARRVEFENLSPEAFTLDYLLYVP